MRNTNTCATNALTYHCFIGLCPEFLSIFLEYFRSNGGCLFYCFSFFNRWNEKNGIVVFLARVSVFFFVVCFLEPSSVERTEFIDDENWNEMKANYWIIIHPHELTFGKIFMLFFGSQFLCSSFLRKKSKSVENSRSVKVSNNSCFCLVCSV
jgi:hypothetical protein